ncbi:MAG TPA: VWA domain-containing protein [Thermoanaerobaculia bacterium]|nr:VWA domain-containing protein [Thermoanaerobaculia bacterium]
MRPILLFVLLAFLAGPSGAQEPAPAPPAAVSRTFSDTLDVQAVQLDVVVTDGQRQRVHGLTAADFRLLVDGEEVPVESFEEVRDGQVVTPGSQLEEGHRYLIFIDEVSINPLYDMQRLRDEALKGIASDLRTLDPRDQVAIVAMDGRQLEVLCPWTSGGPALDRLLQRMLRHTGFLAGSGVRLESTGPDFDRRLAAYQGHLDRLYAEEAWRLGAVDDTRKELKPSEQAVGAAAAALRAFSGVSGRKIMLLLSAGWWDDPAPKKKIQRFPNHPDIVWTESRKPDGERTLGSQLRPIVDTANLVGFTVYPIFLVWVTEPGPLQVAQAGPGEGLLLTAAETGGDLLRPGRNRHLGKVVADTADTYRLAFTFTGDDRRRDIKVEVRRPGVQVRSPNSFLPLSRRVRNALQLDQTLLTGAPRPPLTVSAGAMRKIGDGLAELPLTVRLPDDPAARTGQLELRIASVTRKGDRVVLPALSVPSVSEAAPGLSQEVRIQVRHAPQDLDLVLVDLVSGKSFAGQVRVEPRS